MTWNQSSVPPDKLSQRHQLFLSPYQPTALTKDHDQENVEQASTVNKRLDSVASQCKQSRQNGGRYRQTSANLVLMIER